MPGFQTLGFPFRFLTASLIAALENIAGARHSYGDAPERGTRLQLVGPRAAAENLRSTVLHQAAARGRNLLGLRSKGDFDTASQ